MWVHGGGFCGGDKTSGEIVDEATDISKKGYFNVSINYRLYAPGCSAAAAAPAPAASRRSSTRSTTRRPRCASCARTRRPTDRPDRIAIGGTSAGAITAMHVGANTEDPGTSGNPGFSSAVKGAVSLSGAKLLGAAR